MKQALSLLLVSSALACSCSPDLRESKVPSVVKNTLAARFSLTDGVEWEKARQNYEAEFKVDTVAYAVLINPGGTLLRYKHDITPAVLPAAVQQTIQGQYAGYEVDEVEKIEDNGKAFYQVEVEKGLKELRLVLTEDGAINNNIPYWD